MSDLRGRMNLSGSAATTAARSSLGKPTPITVSSRENATKTIRPTRNLIWSRTTTSYDLGRVEVMRRTSSTEITRTTLVRPSDKGSPVDRDAVDEQPKPKREARARIVRQHGLAVRQLGACGVPLQPGLLVGGEAEDVVEHRAAGEVGMRVFEARVRGRRGESRQHLCDG